MFVTLEPCPMCSGAIILSRVKEVYYGAADLKGWTAGTLMNLLEDERFNHQSQVEVWILEAECKALLQEFFRNLRKQRKEERRNHLKRVHQQQLENES